MSDWLYEDFGIGNDTWKYPKDGTIKNGNLKQWSNMDNLHKAQQIKIQSLQEQRDIAVEALEEIIENTNGGHWFAEQAIKRIKALNE